MRGGGLAGGGIRGKGKGCRSDGEEADEFLTSVRSESPLAVKRSGIPVSTDRTLGW